MNILARAGLKPTSVVHRGEH